jgi:hypothetical protein
MGRGSVKKRQSRAFGRRRNQWPSFIDSRELNLFPILESYAARACQIREKDFDRKERRTMRQVLSPMP